MQCAVVDGVKLNTSLLEFGERRSELRLILQRNAVDGAQAKLQPRCDKTAALVSNRTLENRSLIQRNEQSPGVEGRLANQALAASDTAVLGASKKIRPAHIANSGAPQRLNTA